MNNTIKNMIKRYKNYINKRSKKFYKIFMKKNIKIYILYYNKSECFSLNWNIFVAQQSILNYSCFMKPSYPFHMTFFIILGYG